MPKFKKLDLAKFPKIKTSRILPDPQYKILILSPNLSAQLITIFPAASLDTARPPGLRPRE